MKAFRNHWYYWYTGHKTVALVSMVSSTAIIWWLSGGWAAFSIWSIIVAVFFDASGLVLALLYMGLLRTHIPEATDYFPDYLRLDLKAKADELVMGQVVEPMVVACFVNRITAFVVARLFLSDQGWS
jgi:hypothetical protein